MIFTSSLPNLSAMRSDGLRFGGNSQAYGYGPALRVLWQNDEA